MRLDSRVVVEGLAPTRSRARDLVTRGFVRVNGLICQKPGHVCPEGAHVEVVSGAPAYVSRGAEKLSAALDHFAVSVAGCVAADIGASTGGFTEVLLDRGARRVFAVDAGTGQLHDTLRADPRVCNLEQTDARGLSHAEIPEDLDLIAVDVSFISLRKVLPTVLDLAAPQCTLIALVKPQFEVGPAHVARGGIVRDPEARQRALENVMSWLGAQTGWSVIGHIPSPIAGGSGNQEFLIAGARHG